MSRLMDEWRERAKVEAQQPPKPRGRYDTGDKPPIDWDAEDRLGTVPDSVLAAEYKVTPGAVSLARRRRGIRPYQGAVHYETRVCPTCQRPFVPRRYNAKYCSVYCGSKARGKRRRAVPAKLRRKVMVRDNFMCRYCGRNVHDGAKLHVDHVVPDTLGGPTIIGNLVTACDLCNLGKGDRDSVAPVPRHEGIGITCRR